MEGSEVVKFSLDGGNRSGDERSMLLAITSMFRERDKVETNVTFETDDDVNLRIQPKAVARE